jgi:aminopeptidase-like protein
MAFKKNLFQVEPDIGKRMYGLIRRLYPICRSITGNGVRETLGIIAEHIPCSVVEVPTGTKVFDWTVPKEWNISDAYIKNAKGEKIVDFKDSNLHVLSYSRPFQGMVSLGELKKHLFTIPELPQHIPYRTSYYNEDWGFCLSHNQYLRLTDDRYEVVINATLEEGYLTYGQCVLKGETEQEVLISCHICHPSLCNDNLSGIALTVFLASHLCQTLTRYTYRFLFVPVTIGSITWLASHESSLPDIRHGLVAANLGDSGNFTYKKSRQGNAEIDQAVANVLAGSGFGYKIMDFSPYGYDERQYCSPGFNLPLGCLTRTPHGDYPEYHTSADNLDFVKSENLLDSFSVYASVLNVLENNKIYINQNPKCEPQLGKRGLYDKIGGDSDSKDKQMALLWTLNLSDGGHSLLDISNRSGMSFPLIKNAADTLTESGLLKEAAE